MNVSGGFVRPQVISIGEVLFDVFPDRELLAGAPLNVITHICRLGHPVAFLSGVGADAAGDRASAEMRALGLSTEWITRSSSRTGRVEVTLDRGEPSYSILRDVAYEDIDLPEDSIVALLEAAPKWMYYGTLAQCAPITRATTESLFRNLPATKRFYDLNLRVGFDDPEVIISLMQAASVVKLNALESVYLCGMLGWQDHSEEAFCRALQGRFSLDAVCVTRGEGGASLLYHDCYLRQSAPAIRVVDTVGAGDAFAAACLHGFSEGWNAERILRFGNQLGSYVATQHGAIPPMSKVDFDRLMNE